MKALLPLTAALVLALSACKADDHASPADTAASKEPAPAASVPPASLPPSLPEPGEASGQPTSSQLAGWQGYGDLKLGSTVEEARQAWGGELNSSTPSEGGSCYQLTPKWATDKADVAFMIEHDHFVRYDVTTSKETAPGGGKVGMDEGQLRALYGDALSSMPHKYVEGGKYLSVSQGKDKLVFETGADGKVTSWRVGLPPQIDYVEGCA
ncbi:lectin [Pseudoxanthomonas sp. JBR18]|uniref:lectin n=1 Tax=Pseudoxanthomonas sp. JBR18 TaxID=2969308 RepID=UPI0023061A6D|nr:lectin [Pseudoxanthomonas sp. JBR18]WCE05247.1 lectin [Pseudoxanthomonas sp. JBR18]